MFICFLLYMYFFFVFLFFVKKYMEMMILNGFLINEKYCFIFGKKLGRLYLWLWLKWVWIYLMFWSYVLCLFFNMRGGSEVFVLVLLMWGWWYVLLNYCLRRWMKFVFVYFGICVKIIGCMGLYDFIFGFDVLV